jgi:hypothetical protein
LAEFIQAESPFPPTRFRQNGFRQKGLWQITWQITLCTNWILAEWILAEWILAEWILAEWILAEWI